MKKVFLLVFFGCFCINGFGQSPFQNISFEQALKNARKAGKLIFLQYESATCVQCNDVAKSAFSDPGLASTLSNDFIAIKLSPENNRYINIGTRYDIGKGFGSLFIDSDGRLIHAMKMSASLPREYFEQIDIARKKLATRSSLKTYEKTYFEADKKNVSDLEKLIEAKNILDEPTDLLLTEYVNLLPADSLKSIRTVLFLARQAPIVRSKADLKMRDDNDVFRKAWYSMNLGERIAINNRIIRKSLNTAVMNKNEAFAKEVARFASGTTDSASSRITYYANLSEFYFLTKDTLNYLKTAVLRYDEYAAKTTDQYIKSADSAARENAFRGTAPVSRHQGSDGRTTERFVVGIKDNGSEVAAILNTAAWRFYNLDSKNLYTEKALKWAERSVQVFENQNNLDTYARLLYKAGRVDEAIATEEKAIIKSIQFGKERTEWRAIIEKMKKGKPLE